MQTQIQAAMHPAQPIDFASCLKKTLYINPRNAAYASHLYSVMDDWDTFHKAIMDIPSNILTHVVNTPLHGMYTLLSLACAKSCYLAALSLLYAGADVNQVPSSSVERDSPLITLIVNAKMDVRITVLDVSAVEIVAAELILRGATVNFINSRLETALMWARHTKNQVLIDLLVESGAAEELEYN